jgi:hypothetical protein
MKQDSDGAENQAVRVESEPGFSRRMVAGSFAAIVASIAGSSGGRAATSGDARKPFAPVAGVDYATTDSAYYDPDYPPMHFPHVFMSKGKPIQSFMWLANGKEAKGCVILSPQAYGGDSLDSLVPALVGSGINVLRFNPRGMWDDEQEYSFTGALEDLHAAVAFLRQNGGQHTVPPGTGPARPFHIDVNRIAVLGKSGGGGMVGWIAAAENPNLNTVITVSPAELLRPPLPEAYLKTFSDLKTSTAGRIDLLSLLNKLTPADFERFSMTKAAPRLVNKNVLLIGSVGRDYLRDIHRPIVQSMDKAGAKHFSNVILEADEYYLTARVALARLVVSWLKTECGY